MKDYIIIENGKCKCNHCGKIYSTKGIGSHIWRKHGDGKNWNNHRSGKAAWNKGLTKETDERVKKGGKTYSKAYRDGKFKVWCDGKKIPEETKKKISESMKKAHKEGRSWNIGQSRWNNEASYPEIFFKEVINNEFNDKNYESEYPIGIYSADFAWVHLKKIIEIDGSQHKRFEEYKERDKRKDIFLKKNGWKILRLEWKKVFKDTKKYIKIAKSFIDN